MSFAVLNWMWGYYEFYMLNDCCYIALKLVYCTHFEAGKIFRLKSQKYFKNQCIIGKQIQMQTLMENSSLLSTNMLNDCG